jgi:DNA-binding MurR/RpiR family transcriptional regulator
MMSATEDKMREALGMLSRNGPPKVAGLSRWLLDHLDTVAFHSIRSLAQEAGVDPNVIPRVARALGYDGYDPFRSAVQQIVQMRRGSYGDRARALRASKGSDVYEAMIEASRQNFARVTSADSVLDIEACAEALLTARRVHSVGVRSCFSIAHYFSYVGAMAFDNFVQVPSMPGAILDQMSQTGPEDVVVAITFEHYSAEVVRACQVARERGARIIALTDAHSSPIAQDAWKVILLPMAGPQLMPSLASAFLMTEMILTSMASRSDQAAEKTSDFEQRIADYGGYLPR